MKKFILFILTVLLLVTLFMSGCVQKSESTTVTTGNTVTAAPASGGEGVLNLLGSDPTTLDPAILVEANSGEYVLQIFNGLLRLDEKLDPVGGYRQRLAGQLRRFNLYL